MVAVVQAVDYPDRLVTLKNEEGKIVTIKAGEEVCNLVQIKPGAIVKATYSEALAVQLTKSRAEAMGVPPDHPDGAPSGRGGFMRAQRGSMETARASVMVTWIVSPSLRSVR